MASVQTMKDLGEQMGLKGTELRKFIKEQHDLEREESSQQRNMTEYNRTRTISLD